MDIYFIRHGETPYNRQHIHQPEDAPLDELGRQQALATAKRVHALRPTHLFSSNLARAEETANLMNRSLKLPHTSFPDFAELRRPVSVLGRPHFGIRSFLYMFKWFYSVDELYNSDTRGESRRSFLQRIRTSRIHLEALPADARVIVVSHSVFINFFVEHVCNDNPVPIWKAALMLLKIKRLDNSSLTHVQFDPDAPDKTCRWTVLSFDDDAHVLT